MKIFHPKISVIIPVYNAEKYISRCVDSILSQTTDDFELLLIVFTKSFLYWEILSLGIPIIVPLSATPNKISPPCVLEKMKGRLNK